MEQLMIQWKQNGAWTDYEPGNYYEGRAIAESMLRHLNTHHGEHEYRIVPYDAEKYHVEA